MVQLEFFWDVGSPYTYLASTQIDALAARTGVELVYRPFLLGGVFKASNNVMPGANPAKAAYMMADLRRWRAHYGVSLRIPVEEVTFPLNTVLPMRVATAASKEGKAEQICHALMKAYWVDGGDVSDEAVLRPAIEAAGLDPAATLEAAVSPEVKQSLREVTDEAVRRGAFGAPALFWGDELFWGNDRLHLLEEAIRAGR